MDASSQPEPMAYPPLNFDFEAYTHHLDELDLTEDQKRDLLEALFQIVRSFVDLGFNMHPVQQACGQNTLIASKPLPSKGKRV